MRERFSSDNESKKIVRVNSLWYKKYCQGYFSEVSIF